MCVYEWSGRLMSAGTPWPAADFASGFELAVGPGLPSFTSLRPVTSPFAARLPDPSREVKGGADLGSGPLLPVRRFDDAL
jgi:hypothetical protein